MPKLFRISVVVNDKISCRTAWIFEFMRAKHLEASIGYLEDFTENMRCIHVDSAMRLVTKTRAYLITTYYS